MSRAKKNITLTVVEIEKTHEYFRISSGCQSIINGGIERNYADFFEAMEKLANARIFFAAHRMIKSSSAALITIDGLLKVHTFIIRRSLIRLESH